MNKIIKISVPARLHVNLFDMSNIGYRQNGGIGFCISGLDTIIEFEPSQNFQISDNRLICFTAEEEKSLIGFLKNLYNTKGYIQKFSIKFISGPPPHSGFGTGTATKLACSEAASILNNITPDHIQLISDSKRGGTSGVGINTYFQGGLSIDFGVKATGIPFGPSSARQGLLAQPVQLMNVHIPDNWRFGVIVPLREHRISADEEVEFFNRTCPVDLSSVHESIYHAISGMACGALESDLPTFYSSINSSQQSQWKKAEWMAQSSNIRTLRDKIKEAGAGCVGLSSLGPAIYFMATNIDDLAGELELSSEYMIVQCSPNNTGRTLEID